MRFPALILAPVLLSSLLAGLAGADDDALTQEQLLEAVGWDLSRIEIESVEVRDGLHVLYGAGGNVAASIGADGVLLVDDQFAELAPRIDAELRRLGGGAPVRIVNTHWHFDHAAGNLHYGPAGATILAQRRSAEQLAVGGLIDLVGIRHRQLPHPAEALPQRVFDDRHAFTWNGEEVELLHFGPAHTAGDAAVLFRGRDAVHMGDVFNTSGYPFIDAGSGGGIDGVIAFCRGVLAEIGPDTVVIPGHGRVSDRARLEGYVAMLETVRGRVAERLAAGESLEQVLAAKPTADLDATWGSPDSVELFVDRVYTSLSRERTASAGGR